MICEALMNTFTLAMEISTLWSQWIWPLIMFVIGLGLVIAVHEFGHFIAAKKLGVKVEEFAIGFGKRIIGIQKGETLYSFRIIPLGGYVKMLGQDDFRPTSAAQADPRSWQRASPGRRLIILSAGVFMNVVFAIVVFVIVYMVGIRFVAPVVGGVEPGFPAATVVLPDKVAKAMGVEKAVGLMPGDRIIAINGKKVRRFSQVQMAAILSDTDDVFRLTIVRRIKGKDIQFDVDLKPKLIDRGPLVAKYGRYYAFGLIRPFTTIIEEPGQNGYAGSERFKKGDKIIAIDNKEVKNFWDIEPLIRSCAGRDFDVVVLRGGKRVTVRLSEPVVMGASEGNSQEVLEILGACSRLKIAAVGKHTPAEKAGLKEGDIIVDYNSEGPPSRSELLEINKKREGKPTPITVLRDGKRLTLTITPRKSNDRVLIGIIAAPEQETVTVARVVPASPVDTIRVAEGAVITGVNDEKITSWSDFYAQLCKFRGKKVVLSYVLAGKKRHGDIGILDAKKFNPDNYFLGTPAIAGYLEMKTEPIRGHPLQALLWSAEDTLMWMGSAYKTLRNIFKRRASLKGVSGPVGIGTAAVMTGRKGMVELAYFMAMLSALVAVFNFLPLPVLDGGHVVLVLIEKIRGKPLPMKVVAGIQYAGWILIILVFTLITWIDIQRLLP